jgi:hypothetical protein
VLGPSLWCEGGELFWAQGRSEQAREAFERGWELVRGCAVTIADPGLRARFLRGRPAYARIAARLGVALEDALGTAGD